MNTINIMYSDDNLDLAALKCLNELGEKNENLNIIEDEFTDESNYEILISKIKEKNINILIIDSKLYTVDNKNKKYTGEEFRIILKHFFPFIETLIITQNDVPGDDIIKKYDVNENKDITSGEYYDKFLISKIKEKIEKIELSKKLLKEIESKETIDKIIIEKIELSLENDDSYKELKTSDIDKFVKKFIELKKMIENGQK